MRRLVTVRQPDTSHSYSLMHLLIGLLIAAVLLAAPLEAQAVAVPPAVHDAATAALNTHLGLARLRRLRCVSRTFANCPGGLQVVQDFVLLPGTMRGDTVALPVLWHVLGSVASSEASFMFLPDRSETHVDSARVTMIRRGGRWTMHSVFVASEGSQTSVSAARQFFQFDADDRRILDSLARVHVPLRAPPEER